jgi:methionine-S-sulfoxide reductase
MITLILILLMTNQPKQIETIVLGGGCFWCTEAIYMNVEGVIEVTPGYSGGEQANPSYNDVCSGETGHAEVVMIKFDPTIVDLELILDVFFMTHDPTTLNRQGADVGSQYRSVIFYSSDKQKETAIDKIDKIKKESIFKNSIVTEVVPFANFYQAEDYHINYYNRNKNQPYCRFIIEPKLEKFKMRFPKL